MTQKKKKRIIVVLGMHRSGTSAITRGLAVLGVNLGNYLIPAEKNNNETGFWEDIDLNTFDNELLAFLGHDWHTLTPILPAEFKRPDLAAFKLRAVELLRKKMRGVPVFGMKDPRIAILLPFWQDVFRHIGAEVSYVIAVRHPLSVVRSLNKRDGFDPEKSYYLWLEHTVPCLLKSADSPRVVVDFDLLMEQPEQQLRRLAEALSLSFDGRTSAVKEYTQEFLRDDLRHTRFHLDDLKLDPSVPPEAVSAFELLDKLSNDHLDAGDPQVQTFFQTLEQHLATLRPALNYMTRQDEHLAGLQQNLTAQNQTLAERDQTLVAQTAQIAERTGKIAALNQAVAERDGKITTLSQAVAVKDQSLVKLNEQIAGLSKDIAERTGKIAEHTDQVANLNQTVAERDAKIAELDQAMAVIRIRSAVLNQTVVERDQTLAERDAQMAGLDQETAKRDERISVLNQTANEKIAELAALNKQIETLSQTLAERTAALAGRGAQIDVLRQEAAGRDIQIAGLNQTATEKVAELAARNKQIEALSQTLAERTAALAGRGAQIDRLRQEAAGRDKQIATLNRTADAQTLALAERETQIAALNRMATERDAVLSERDIQIDGLLKNIAELNSQIAGLSQSLTDRNTQIAALDQTVMERDQALSGRDAQIGGLNQAVAERDGRIGQLERQLSDVQTLLNSVLASPSWKITEPLRWFRRNLITRPLKWIRQTPEKWLQKVWHRCGLSVDKKEKIKAVVFGLFPTFLGGTAACKLWKQVRSASQQVRPSPSVQPCLPAERAQYVECSKDHVDAARSRVKAIAFYLPQFHPIPENDAAWGKGFTEWTNVTKAKPQFAGHHQPRVPGELGYYDLRERAVKQRQIELAKQHGIYGFCYHYYWFDGHKVLETPLNQMLADPSLDFPFCLCWANENWTRKWDGGDNAIILEQKYTPENDLHFIKDITPVLKDPRYIRIDGKPLLVVYRPALLPDPAATAKRWREFARKEGVGELYIAAAQTFCFDDYERIGFDGLVQFPPHNFGKNKITDTLDLINKEYTGHVYDYESYKANSLAALVNRKHTFPGVMVEWDNEARRPGDGWCYHNASPEKYKEWLASAFTHADTNNCPDEKFVFINAWNEWAEGTYLEPDRTNGYAYLQATADVVSRYSAADGENHAGAAGPEYVPLLQAEPLKEKPVRLISFYLPQFHAIPENDAWWGKGFTEWINVKPAQPQFEGHYQPRVPGELGYYNLLDKSVQKRQVELAKLYGIGGFCFYFYWFGGKRLLEMPIRNYLNDRTLDLPFCLCWANENWTRAWDGLDKEVLIAQKHSPEDELAFIQHVAQYMRDPRYIRIDGKPLLLVYRPSLLPSAKETSERWRKWCRENGIGEIYLAYTQSFETVDPKKYGFDAAIEFPPNNSAPPNITASVKPLRDDFGCIVYDWRTLVERSRQYKKPDYTLFRGVCPAWDNTARRGNRSSILLNSSPCDYQEWLCNAVADTCERFRSPDERLIFVNAWNEWAEGAHLEPDQKYGYAYLQATRDALISMQTSDNPSILIVTHDCFPCGSQFLILETAKQIKALGYKVFILALDGGKLLENFQGIGPTLNAETASDGELTNFLASLRVAGTQYAITGSVVCGKILVQLKEQNFKVLSLIHELPGVLRDMKQEQNAAWISQHSDTIVFAAEMVRQGFQDFSPTAFEKTVIRPQGVLRKNPYKTRKEEAHKIICKKHNLPKNSRIVLNIAYVYARKGPDLFLKIAEQTLREIPEAVFIWIGHADPQAEKQVQDKIEEMNLGKKVLFPGYDPDPLAYYAAASAFALTSREDPFPNVVLEAAEVGLPVVAFEGASGAEDFIAQQNGRLAKNMDTEDFSRHLCDVLKNKPAPADNPVGSLRQYALDILHHLTSQPRISVVVPNYNYANHITQRLDSICRQTIPVYELIVLDDASSDKSTEIIRGYLGRADVDARLIVNTSNSGSVFRQWRKALDYSKGDLLWIAEADDLAEPGLLEALLPAFNDPSVVMAYCQSKPIDGAGKILAENYLGYTGDISDIWQNDYLRDGREEIREAHCIKNPILNVSAVLFRRTALQQAFDAAGDGLFGYQIAGDWLIYLHVLMQGKVHFCSKPLNLHRRHANNVTNSTKKIRHFEEVCKVQETARTLVTPDPETLIKANAYIEYLHDHFEFQKEKNLRDAASKIVQ